MEIKFTLEYEDQTCHNTPSWAGIPRISLFDHCQETYIYISLICPSSSQCHMSNIFRTGLMPFTHSVHLFPNNSCSVFTFQDDMSKQWKRLFIFKPCFAYYWSLLLAEEIIVFHKKRSCQRFLKRKNTGPGNPTAVALC